MSEIGLDDSHVRSHFHVQASEAVAGTVKGDFLGYPCCREPPLEWSLQHLVLEILKDKSLAPFSQQSIGFITDGVMHYFFGFLHTGGNEHPAVGVWLYLLPRELSDVALSQSRKTGEKKSFFQDLLLTGCFGKPYQFLLAQMLLMVGMHSMRSKKPFGFSFIFLSR